MKSDIYFINETIKLANEAEKEGNLPIAAIIVLDEKIIAIGKNSIFNPEFHPLKHAEIEALNKVDKHLLQTRSKEMVIYTNVEPCLMCFGAIVLHKIGKVVFGGSDSNKGATYLKNEIGKIYSANQLPEFVGPLMQDVCGKMWEKANTIYRNKLKNK